jgi:hypothetical protein
MCGGYHWLDHPRTVRPPYVHSQNTTSHTKLRVRVNSRVEPVWREANKCKHAIRRSLIKDTNNCVLCGRLTAWAGVWLYITIPLQWWPCESIMNYANQYKRPEKPIDSTFNINIVVIPVPPLWPKKAAFGSRSWRVSLLCPTSRRTGQSFIT